MSGVEEIRTKLLQARRLPDGRAKTELLENLAEWAKAEWDRSLEAQVLLELSDSYSFGGGPNRQPVVFARLLKIYDEFPAELGAHTHSIHWQLKWLTGALVSKTSVPRASAHKWLDEFESRYRQRGYSLRPVLSLRSSLAVLEGEHAAARAFMDASIAAPRDEMANCEACERNAWGDLQVDLGDDEAACRDWEPLLAGRLRCREEPARVLAKALMPLVRLGRLDEARSAHLRGYQLARGRAGLRASVAYHIEFCALTGNEARGLEILTEHKDWLLDRPVKSRGRRHHATSVLVLLRQLATLGLSDLQIGTVTVAGALDSLTAEVDRSCARSDARNGSTYISDLTARRLGAQPTGDWLPLGFSAKLPERVTRKPVAPRTAAASARTGDRAEAEAAEDLARDHLEHDAARAESYARQAVELGGSALEPEAVARLGSLLVEAISRQPGREPDLIDAALRAAARWQGISEPDELRLIFTAARAYHEQGRHGEAAALFGEAMPRVDIAYQPYTAAMTRKAYSESLRALRQHKAAAEQLVIAARLIEEHPESRVAYAQVSWSAAESLSASGNPVAAIAAYEKAVELWRELGVTGPLARCRRAAAWLYLGQNRRGLALKLMRETRDELREAVEISAPEAAAELAETEKQLRQMMRARPEA
ncbi:hypothetical protein [Actinospica robiniae]|uniref:hypothetical protein n=1 Tax=Actinospica robiniae TaxID=304901 RepID=UPI00040DEDD2|nr:hypothetical protein [Actinospica robiniae]